MADSVEAALVVLDVWRGSDDVVLYELFVAARCRGIGIGTATLTEVEKYTTRLGRSRVKLIPRSLDPNVNDEVLIQWYCKRGYWWETGNLGFLVKVVGPGWTGPN